MNIDRALGLIVTVLIIVLLIVLILILADGSASFSVDTAR